MLQTITNIPNYILAFVIKYWKILLILLVVLSLGIISVTAVFATKLSSKKTVLNTESPSSQFPKVGSPSSSSSKSSSSSSKANTLPEKLQSAQTSILDPENTQGIILLPKSVEKSAEVKTSTPVSSEANVIAQTRKEAENTIVKVNPIMVEVVAPKPVVVETPKVTTPAPTPVVVTPVNVAPVDPIALASKAEWDKAFVNFVKPTTFTPAASGLSVKANLATGKLEVYNNGTLDKTFDFSQGCNMTYASCVNDQSKDKTWLQTPSLYCVNGFSAQDFKFQVAEGRKARTSKYVISLVCQTLDGTWQGTDIMLHTNDWNGTKTGGCIMPVAGQSYSFVEYLFNKDFTIMFI